MIGKILYPKKAFGWLGVSSRSFRIALAARGLWGKDFGSQADDTGQCDDVALSKRQLEDEISEGELYPCCIEAEQTPAELAGDSQKREVLLARWRPKMAAERERIGSLLRRDNPSGIALIQGFEPSSWVARSEAIKLGIPFVSFENTALRDRVVWDDVSGITVNRNLAANFFWRFKGELATSEVEQSIARIIATTKEKKTAEHQSPAQAKSFGKDRPNILYLGQVYTDSSLLFGSGRWKSPVELIEALLRISVEVGARLIVKLHPKELNGFAPVTGKAYSKLTYRKILASAWLKEELERGENLVVDHENSFDTYDLIQGSDVAVTMNSQAGLEALIRGIPTVTCGSCFYGGLGFTGVGLTTESLHQAVIEALNKGLSSQAKFEAKTFAHVFFNKYCIEKTEKSIARLISASIKRRMPSV